MSTHIEKTAQSGEVLQLNINTLGSTNLEPYLCGADGTILRPLVVYRRASLNGESAQDISDLWHSGTLQSSHEAHEMPLIRNPVTGVLESEGGHDVGFAAFLALQNTDLEIIVPSALPKEEEIIIPSSPYLKDTYVIPNPTSENRLDITSKPTELFNKASAQGKTLEEMRGGISEFSVEKHEIAEDIAFLLESDVKDVVDDGSKWIHQQLALKELWRHLKDTQDIGDATIMSATGTGKTKIQEDLLFKLTNAGYRNIIHVSPRTGIMEQSHNAMKKSFDSTALWYGEQKDKINKNTKAIFTTYDSYVDVVELMIRAGLYPPIVIFDEAHNLNQQRRKILEIEGTRNSVKLGFTATPGSEGRSLDERGLPVVFTFGLEEGISRGVLCPFRAGMYRFSNSQAVQNKLNRILARNSNQITREYIDEIMKEGSGYAPAAVEIAFEECSSTYKTKGKEIRDILEPTIIEAKDIAQANEIFEIIKSKGNLSASALRKVAILSSENSAKENKRILDEARTGAINWIIAIDMMTEGINIPRFSNIIMRPRPYSETQHDQALGRVLRGMRGKVARIFQLFDTDTPELLGYRTIRSMLGMVDLDPDQIFTGDVLEYNTLIREKKKRSRDTGGEASKSMPSGWTKKSYSLIDTIVFEKSPDNPKHLWNYVESEEMFVEFLRFHLRKYGFDYETGSPALKYVNPVIYKKYKSGARWVINKERFQEIFGITLHQVKSQFPKLDLITTLADIENELGIMSIFLACQHPKKLYFYSQALITSGQLQNTSTTNAKLAEAFRTSTDALDNIILQWSESGELPPEVNTMRAFINYTFLLYNFDRYCVDLPFLQIDRSKFPSTAELLQHVEKEFISHVAMSIERSYERRGFYFRPPKYNTERYAGLYGVSPSLSKSFIAALRRPARTLQKEGGAAMSSASAAKFFFDIVEKAEVQAERCGIVISANPYREDTYTGAYTFIYERALHHIQKGGTFLDGNFGLNPKTDTILEDIFGIRHGELKRLCRSWGTAPSELFQPIIALVETEYQVSYNMYMRPSDWRDSANLVAQYLFEHYPELQYILPSNFEDYAPNLPRKEGIGITVGAKKGEVSWAFTTFCDDRGIKPSTFCHFVIQEVKRLKGIAN
jgi:superfamily II DNA or RNA helicase